MQDKKITAVIQVMISLPGNIKDVQPAAWGHGYFFMYKKYVWAIFTDPAVGHFYLHFFPKAEKPSDANELMNETPRITYSTENDPLDVNDFEQLYELVKSKLFGMDSVFDDILGDASPF